VIIASRKGLRKRKMNLLMARSTAIGVEEVRKWAGTLPPGGSVIDLGCGPGFPITVARDE